MVADNFIRNASGFFQYGGRELLKAGSFAFQGADIGGNIVNGSLRFLMQRSYVAGKRRINPLHGTGNGFSHIIQVLNLNRNAFLQSIAANHQLVNFLSKSGTVRSQL